MKFKAFPLIAVSIAFALSSCAKKPEPVVDPIAPPEPEPVLDESAGQNGKKSAEDEELARKQARLQELLDRIMSEDIYFDFDRSALTEQAKGLLAEVGEILLSEARFELTIEGHTDERGTESYNMSLGSKRAKAVQQFLVDLGIEGKRLDTISFGEAAPKVEGSSEEAWAKNRRAHFKVNIR